MTTVCKWPPFILSRANLQTHPVNHYLSRALSIQFRSQATLNKWCWIDESQQCFSSDCLHKLQNSELGYLRFTLWNTYTYLSTKYGLVEKFAFFSSQPSWSIFRFLKLCSTTYLKEFYKNFRILQMKSLWFLILSAVQYSQYYIYSRTCALRAHSSRCPSWRFTDPSGIFRFVYTSLLQGHPHQIVLFY